MSSNEPEAPRIQAPFQLEPLKHLLSTARECLDNNFLSSFLTLVGSIMAFHYTSILVTQDECPLILCYSRESGTGMFWKISISWRLMILLVVLSIPHRQVYITAECPKCVWNGVKHQWTGDKPCSSAWSTRLLLPHFRLVFVSDSSCMYFCGSFTSASIFVE